MSNNLKVDNLVAKKTQADFSKTNAFEGGNVMNHSVAGVTEPFQRTVNLPSNVLTPAFGLFKLSQEVAVFRTAMSLINKIKPKIKAIENIYNILRDNSDTDGLEAARAKVHSIIAERVGGAEWETLILIT